MKVVLAIDPGVSGGIAVEIFGKVVGHAMPATQGDVLELIRDVKWAADTEDATCECVLEEVSEFAGKAQPGAAMFKFGDGYGFLKGVVMALGIRFVLVRPQVWQKVFGLGTAVRCASKSEWKHKLKTEAQRRFPDLGVTLATADALLILEFHNLGVHGCELDARQRTTFSLNTHIVDELKAAARTLLYQNADFKKLLTDLGTSAPGVSNGSNGAAK